MSAGIRGCIKFFRYKKACLAFSQHKLSGELLVAIVSGVLAFLPK